MRRRATALAALVLASTAVGAAALPAGAASATAAHGTACASGWGSGEKTGAATGAAPLEDVRTGRHECYDRMVFDVPGVGSGGIGYHVRYVKRLYQDGSGAVVPVRGGAILDIHITAPSYDPDTGEPTYPGRVGRPLPGVDLAGYRTFKDTRFAGSFEGDTQIGLGVRARLPFRVVQVPGRLVVDVAHTWGGGR